jgi:ADP-ribosylglycohydrolase
MVVKDRLAMVGACVSLRLARPFSDDLSAAVEHAARSAQVRHPHPEAVAGAIASAVAAAVAWQLRQHDRIPCGEHFLDLILPHIPASAVRDKVQQVQRRSRRCQYFVNRPRGR